jgi:ring-1,2-phenylacetyl-CoA epoxidase subunit PaaC
MGDGTGESHRRMTDGMAALFGFTAEFFEMDEVDRMMAEAGVGPDLGALREPWERDVRAVLDEATLDWPDQGWSVVGGRLEGRHSEHLGYMLTEMQFMQRTYPGLNW